MVVPIMPSMMRVDYGRADAYTRPEADPLSPWQKFGRGLAKFWGNLGGPLTGALTGALLPGIGLPISMAAYGSTRFAQDQLYKASVKDQLAAQANQQTGPISMPGLFEKDSVSAGAMPTDFMVPNEMEPGIGQVVTNRTRAQQEAIINF